MGVADQSARVNFSRRHPFTIHLSTEVVNGVCARLNKSKGSRRETSGITGVLFGSGDEQLARVQAFRPFIKLDTSEDLAVRQEQLDGMFGMLAAVSRGDPELSSFQLVGWYSLHPVESDGLSESELDFHNRHFPGSADLALIVKLEGKKHIALELYSRSSNAPLSRENHRLASIQIPRGTPAIEPLELLMRAPLGDNFYQRAYEVGKTLDRAERREEWKRMLADTKEVALSFLIPKQIGAKQFAIDSAQPPEEISPPVPTRPMESVPPSKEKVKTRIHRSVAPDPVRDLVPMVEQDLPSESAALMPLRDSKRQGIPWISSGVVFLMAAGVTVSFFYLSGAPSGSENGMRRVFRGMFSGNELALRVEGQQDRLLVTWNRQSPVVRSAIGGILLVDDGAGHRTVPLDSEQMKDGSVLYKPNSPDVTFRLEVRGDHGTTAAESMRVLDGANSLSTDASVLQAQSEKQPAVLMRRAEWEDSVGAKTKAPEPAISRGLANRLKEATQPDNSSRVFMGPRPLRQVSPNTDLFGPDDIGGLTRVKVAVDIDEKGRVAAAHLIENGNTIPQPVADSAIAAAKKWTFRPASLHGNAIASDHTIIFEFRPEAP